MQPFGRKNRLYQSQYIIPKKEKVKHHAEWEKWEENEKNGKEWESNLREDLKTARNLKISI